MAEHRPGLARDRRRRSPGLSGLALIPNCCLFVGIGAGWVQRGCVEVVAICRLFRGRVRVLLVWCTILGAFLCRFCLRFFSFFFSFLFSFLLLLNFPLPCYLLHRPPPPAPLSPFDFCDICATCVRACLPACLPACVHVCECIWVCVLMSERSSAGAGLCMKRKKTFFFLFLYSA